MISAGICQYYKTKKKDKDPWVSWNIDRQTNECQPVRLSVSWRESQWTLTPFVSNVPSTAAIGETPSPGNGQISNTGDDTDNFAWDFGRLIVPPGTGDPTTKQGYSGAGPGAFYQNPGWTWQSQASDYATGRLPANYTWPGVWGNYNSINTTTLAPGTKVCWTMSVSQPQYPNPPAPWRHSMPMCTMFGVKPKAQFWGYDVRSGGKVAGSTSTAQGKTFGSWGEYGILSTLPNVSVGSGSGPVNGAGGANGGTSLTFANTNNAPCAGGYGCYGPQNFPTDTVNRLKPTGCDSGDKTISATTYNNASPLSPICTTGTVTIEGNITYDPGTATVSDGRFAQQVILAKDIVIKAGVTRVDAWLVTQDENGIVSTCATDNSGEAGKLTPANARLHAGICNQPLKINGPVIAGKLYLYRTHYNSTEPGEPAEIINLRPDAFLAAHNGTGSTPYVQTQNVIELPPRL